MLKITGISFAYDKDSVLDDIDFSVEKGEHLAIMGESGCGKSTLLKLIYGSLQPSSGEIYWGKKKVKGPLFKLVPGESYIKYMSQGFDLMGVTTVAENIAEYLSVIYPKELKERTEELLGVIEMTQFANTKVKYLSIGQQQRVALARALAQKPELLLLDEPFSAVDPITRVGIYDAFRKVQAADGVTTLLVTHDMREAVKLAQDIVILREGLVLQAGPTQSVIDNPADPYVSALVAAHL